MSFYEQLFDNNKKWAAEKLNEDEKFFENMAKGQEPPLLWIGCADSRVPANLITGTDAGDVFVHRNVANMIVHTDLNMLTVLDYAVNVLKVKHVIVCGHHGCGGVLAAMSNKQYGLIDNWLRSIKDVYAMHEETLDAITDVTERGKKFVQLNAIEQVKNLAKTSIIQSSWKNNSGLQLHAWVFDLESGLVTDLEADMSDSSKLPEVNRL